MAAYIANGKKLKPLKNNTYNIPIRVSVSKDNLDQIIEQMKGLPDTQLLDDWLTDEEVMKLFQ